MKLDYLSKFTSLVSKIRSQFLVPSIESVVPVRQVELYGRLILVCNFVKTVHFL